MAFIDIVDSISDDIAEVIYSVRQPPLPANTQAAVYLAQNQQQQQTLLWFGLGALVLVFALKK